MSTIKDGGPVFPCLERGGNGLDLTHAGMTLRDYFAAKAMQGLLSDTQVKAAPDEFAENAYRMADAMLAAREKGGA